MNASDSHETSSPGEIASRSACTAEAWVPYALSPAPDACHSLSVAEVTAAVRSLVGELLAKNAEVRPLVFATLEPLFAAGDVLRVELPASVEAELARRLHEGGWQLERLDAELKALGLPTANDPVPSTENPAALAAEAAPALEPPQTTASDTPQ